MLDTKCVFLVIPMKDRSELAINRDIAEMCEWARSEGYDPVYDEFSDPDANSAFHGVRGLADSIKEMIACDLVAFTPNAPGYRGCRILHDICKAYDIPMVFPTPKGAMA